MFNPARFTPTRLLGSIATAFAILMAPVAHADLSEILESGTVKIAVPENFPPCGSLGAEGEYVGYDVDVANLIAKDLTCEQINSVLELDDNTQFSRYLEVNITGENKWTCRELK